MLNTRPEVQNAHHLYIIVVKTENLKVSRDVIIDEIQKKGVGVAVHFRALHLHPFYRQLLECKEGMFPQAEYYSDRIISLPLYPKMTDDNVARVIEIVQEVVHSFRQ